MAQSVLLNSFLLTTTPHSRVLSSKKPTQFTVFAKNSGPFSSFQLRKSSSDDQDDEGQVKIKNPFQFDWKKLSDVNVQSLIPVISNPSGLVGSRRQKDAGTVFVAGATGQAGVRISQKLLREGFKVRAGVPDLGAAQELARLALDYKIISKEELKRLNAVESTFNDPESIAKAIGNASKVVVTISPLENGPSKEVTTLDALQVVEAAQLAGVGHLAIIYDDSPIASTNNVLDGISLFFNNLFSKTQPLTISEFLQRVIKTDVKYTFIRTSFTDDFAEEGSYNVVVAAEGSIDGTDDYKVARSQVATLVAGVFSNTSIAEDKVVDVYTSPSAPSKPIDELFSVIPEDKRRKQYAEAIAKAQAEEAAAKAAEQAREAAAKAAEQAREAAEAKKKLEEELKSLEEQEARAASLAEDAKQKADVTGASYNDLLRKAKDLGNEFSWDKIGSQLFGAVKSANFEDSKVQIATVRGQAKAQNLPAQKAVIKENTSNVKTKRRPTLKPRPKLAPISAPTPEINAQETKKEVRNILGGLFKQETIYVDE